MHAYSQDLRDRVLGALVRGERPTDIAARFEVSRVWIYQVKKCLDQDGRRTSLPMGGHRKSRIAALQETVSSWIQAQPDLTLADICGRLASEHGVCIKVPALWHQLNKWGLSYKKNSARCRAREARRSGGTD